MRFFKWALWSRAHLLVIVACSFLVLMVVALGGALLTSPPTTTTRASAAPKTASSTVPTSEAARTTDDAARAPVARTEGFVRAWLDTSPGWVGRVRAHVTPDLFETLRTTNTAAIPDATPGPVELVEADEFFAATRVRLSDGTVLNIDLTWDLNRRTWWVSNLTPGDDQ